VFEFGALASSLLAILLLVCGGFSGWRLAVSLRDRGLELRSQVADINWLRAALTDSEKRCAQQAAWLNEMEAEMVALRPQNSTPPSRPAGVQMRSLGPVSLEPVGDLA